VEEIQGNLVGCWTQVGLPQTSTSTSGTINNIPPSAK
jgi:hypothetical protein